MVEIPVNFVCIDEEGYHILINVEAYGRRFKMVLDTGASRSVFDLNTIKRYDGDASLLLSSKLSAGLGTNTMESFTANIPCFRIGEILIENYNIAVLDLSAINTAYEQLESDAVVGVIGGDILMQYKAVIDYGQGRLVLHQQ